MDRAAALAKLAEVIHQGIVACEVLQKGGGRSFQLETCDRHLREALVAAAQASREAR